MNRRAAGPRHHGRCRLLGPGPGSALGVLSGSLSGRANSRRRHTGCASSSKRLDGASRHSHHLVLLAPRLGTTKDRDPGCAVSPLPLLPWSPALSRVSLLVKHTGSEAPCALPALPLAVGSRTADLPPPPGSATLPTGWWQ